MEDLKIPSNKEYQQYKLDFEEEQREREKNRIKNETEEALQRLKGYSHKIAKSVIEMIEIDMKKKEFRQRYIIDIRVTDQIRLLCDDYWSQKVNHGYTNELFDITKFEALPVDKE